VIAPEAVHDIEYSSEANLDLVMLYVFNDYMKKANGNLLIYDESGK
jgi:hypothetical protein